MTGENNFLFALVLGLPHLAIAMGGKKAVQRVFPKGQTCWYFQLFVIVAVDAFLAVHRTFDSHEP